VSIHVSLVQMVHNRLVGFKQLDSGRMYSSQGRASVSSSGLKVRYPALDDFECFSGQATSVAKKSFIHGQ